MAAPQRFRSAFNGFNREDVVRYIDFLNTKHAADLTQLNSELEYLRNCQKQRPTFAPEQDETIAQQAARIRELFDRCAALEQELAAKTGKEVSLVAYSPIRYAELNGDAEALTKITELEQLLSKKTGKDVVLVAFSI